MDAINMNQNITPTVGYIAVLFICIFVVNFAYSVRALRGV
jgi:hypothetical protein